MMAVGVSVPWLIHVVYCLFCLLRSVMMTYIKLKLASFLIKYMLGMLNQNCYCSYIKCIIG